jgi:triphosphoribosyl-dephospho-CoA synthase
MNAKTFYKSILSLRKYFYQIAYLGSAGEDFNLLRHVGICAEQRMLAATEGINTHRGAIFILGILVASAAYKYSNQITGVSLGEIAIRLWGEKLLHHKQFTNSNGSNVKRNFKHGGALEEVLSGYKSIYEFALPEYRSVLKETGSLDLARIQTFFALIANVADTNVIHRGGLDGLKESQNLANNFLISGGVYSSGWEENARDIHSKFIEMNLSPGGCGDLLSACIFIQHIEDA